MTKQKIDEPAPAGFNKRENKLIVEKDKFLTCMRTGMWYDAMV